jgi:hypothetical protein
VPGSESSTQIRTFPDWSESSGHRIRMTCNAHDGGDSPRKTTTGPKSGLKIKIYLKIKVFASSGSHRVRIRALRIRDSDPGLGSGPKSGLNRWHQSRKTDPWLVARSHPDCVTTNRDQDPTYVGTGPDQLPLAKDGKKNGQCY